MSKIRPQDDFYLYKNGQWLDEAQIPADKPLTGAFIEILLRNEKIMMEDLETFAKNGVDHTIYNDPLFDRFISFYKQAINQKQRQQDGNEFIKKYVERILNVSSIEDLQALTINFNLEGMPNLLPLSVYTDMKNASHHALYVSMPNIFLPEKNYYDENGPAFQQGTMLLAKLQDVFQKLFAAIDLENASHIIEKAFQFDKLLVPLTKSAEEQSDYIANYNPYSFDDLNQKIKPFNLSQILNEVVNQKVDQIIVTDTKYIEGFQALLNIDLDIIKSWYIAKVVFSMASSGYGTDDLRVISASYSQILTGQTEIASFEKYTYQSLSNQFGDVVGLYFGHRYFGEKAKKELENMVQEFIGVYQKRLKSIDWLSKETREKAIVKLGKIVPMIGYPDKVHDVYHHFVPNQDKTFAENMMAFNIEAIKQDFLTLNKEVDKKLWGMGAHIVNAYYNPNSNVIVFPAGILQYPFYDYQQPKGANYGGIGAVIAHEITHAFDTNGAQIDENGNINNWWKDEDFAAFNEKAEKMVTLFDGLEIPGATVKANGRLTVTENIADAGGLSCAYEAGITHQDFNPKDFFEGWAVIWRTKSTPAFQDLLANVDVHAPGYLRGQIQLKNFKPFIAYYNVKPGDGMYIDPEKLVEIW